MRLIQHKKEAYWFYRFLSIFYDKLVNPFFWTAHMRDKALEVGQLNDPNLSVIDVGSGTGFTTEGIARYIKTENITCVDQSPHQMAKAKAKEALQGCTFQLGDAENIPFETDAFDRYVSAGSIEYWPNPQKGINEAYRVVKPGGVALMIGPLEPANPLARFIANTWMLFPKEREYREWFQHAGFTEIEQRYVKPQWVSGQGEYGIAIAGRKPQAGEPPVAYKEEENDMAPGPFRWLLIAVRVIVGSLAGFLFIPAALFGYLRLAVSGQQGIPEQYQERLNRYQVGALLITATLILILVWAC